MQETNAQLSLDRRAVSAQVSATEDKKLIYAKEQIRNVLIQC